MRIKQNYEVMNFIYKVGDVDVTVTANQRDYRQVATGN